MITRQQHYNEGTSALAINSTMWNAAIYCRLSVEDQSLQESGSIQTQRTLLTDYCRQHGVHVYNFYIDDGVSGTSFRRPAFDQMIADIEAGKVNMVVVKDLSRFGRNYAEAGMYLDHYFVERDIRFVATQDGVDTLHKSLDISVPMRNIVNDYYTRDVSQKTITGKRVRAKQGLFMGTKAPYGYTKDPNDRHKLIIDPPAAEIVRKIFAMFTDGIGYVRMTKILREQKIFNPQAYFNQNNPDFYKSDYWRQPFDWHATSVRAIISNETYLGKTVFGKTKTKGFHNKKRIKAPEDEWIVVENTHEPIITQETWDIVQKLMASRRRECRNGEIQMFAGLVKCADCGSALNVSYDAKKQKYKNFSCWVYKNYGRERCSSHAIGWKTMCTLVLEDIRRNAQTANIMQQGYLNRLIQMRTDKQKKEVDGYRRELKSADKRIGQLDTTIAKLFESSALGRISEERCQTMLETYESEQRELKTRREVLQAAISQAEEAYSNVENFVNLIQKFTDIQELDAHILNSLVEKIVVHEKETHEDGSISQRVNIHYKFIGYLPLGEILANSNSINGIPTAEIIEQMRRNSA